MSQEELYHSCVGKLYEMALEPQGWGAFLDDFCTLIDAAFAHCVAWDERARTTIFSAASRSIPTGDEQRTSFRLRCSHTESHSLVPPQADRREVLRS